MTQLSRKDHTHILVGLTRLELTSPESRCFSHPNFCATKPLWAGWGREILLDGTRLGGRNAHSSEFWTNALSLSLLCFSTPITTDYSYGSLCMCNEVSEKKHGTTTDFDIQATMIIGTFCNGSWSGWQPFGRNQDRQTQWNALLFQHQISGALGTVPRSILRFSSVISSTAFVCFCRFPPVIVL